MASCGDDFSLIGSNNDSNPNRLPPAPRIPPPYASRFPTRTTVSRGDKANAAGDDQDDSEEYGDAAAFNPFTDQNDAASKRKDQSDELSDGAGSGGGGAGGGNSYTIIRRSKSSAVSAGEYRKDREEWSDSAIACLLDAYLDKFTQLNRGNLRGRDWEEVAVIVSQRSERQTKSVEQCKNKVDNLKKRYKLERHMMSNCGNSPSHWPWFKRMERERSKKQKREKRERSKKKKRENRRERRERTEWSEETWQVEEAYRRFSLEFALTRENT